MKISRIDNIAPSFKRVIKISNVHVPYNEKTKYVVRDNINEIDKVLNNKSSEIYTDEDQGKIRKFFADITEDYNNQALTRKIPNFGIVVITGRDCDKISKMEKKQRVQYNPSSSIQEVSNYRVEKAIFDKLEDGNNGKKKTIIKLYTSADETPYNPCLKNGFKADEIEYISSQKRFFPRVDGHVCRERMLSFQDVCSTRGSKAVDLIYDYSSIMLD